MILIFWKRWSLHLWHSMYWNFINISRILYLFFKIFIYLAAPGLAAALGIFSFCCRTPNFYLQQADSWCSLWRLVPRPGIEPGPLALGAQNLSHWTTREVLHMYFKRMYIIPFGPKRQRIAIHVFPWVVTHKGVFVKLI